MGYILNKLRVFLGTEDTASCLSGLALGFRRRGHTVTTMVEARSRFLPNQRYDIVRGRELQSRFDYTRSSRLVSAIGRRVDARLIGPMVNAASSPQYLEHDLFVFFARPWLPERMLFPLLKRLGKRILFYFLGSDVRHMSAFSAEYGVDISGLRPELSRDPLDSKMRRLRHVELWADHVYSVPDQAGLQIRPYYHSHLPLDVLHQLKPGFPGRAVPVVVHAPSREDVKGTSMVVRAVDDLRRAGVQLELRLLSGVPRSEVLAALEDADILVDELLLHGPGVLSAEAMVSGCAVATRTLEEHRDVFGPPVCSVRPDNLVAKLRRLIEDVPYRMALAHAGRAWALDEHDPARVVEHIEQHLAGGVPYDYTPNFFLERYELPADARLRRETRRLGWEVLRRHRPDAAHLAADARRRGLIEPPLGEP